LAADVPTTPSNDSRETLSEVVVTGIRESLESAQAIKQNSEQIVDSVTAQDIVRLLVAAARERDAAVVMVTHEPTVAAHADRVIAMHSGQIQ